MLRTGIDLVAFESLPRPVAVLRAVSRYDLVLAVIPLALLTSVVSASVSDLPTEPLLGAGAVVCVLAMVDALFVHPPSMPDERDRNRSGRSRQRRAD